MLTQEELNKSYMRSGISSAKIYAHIWESFSRDNGKTKPRGYLSLSPSIESYVLAQVGHLNKKLEWSSIGKEIMSFFKCYPYSPENVLSLGCGIGNGLKTVKKYGSKLLVGIDVGLPVLKLAKSNLPDGDFVCASSTHLPFRDSVFDTFITGHFFEPMTNRESRFTFEEIKRCSIKNCLWFVSVEGEEIFESYHIQKFGKGGWGVIHKHPYISKVSPVPGSDYRLCGAEFLVLKSLYSGNDE